MTATAPAPLAAHGARALAHHLHACGAFPDPLEALAFVERLDGADPTPEDLALLVPAVLDILGGCLTEDQREIVRARPAEALPALRDVLVEALACAEVPDDSPIPQHSTRRTP
jgi:hypothetical protein